VDRWKRLDTQRVERCGIFDLKQIRFDPPDERAPRPFWVLDAPDWINVIPLTDDGCVRMIRQYRYGIEDVTLEIPGGMCDPQETPEHAARRELREETGCECGELVELGWVHPNPAIQNNRCHSYLARGVVRVGEPQPDPNEGFEQVEVPLADVPRLIRDGRITHSLVVAAFHLLDRL